MAYVLPDKYDDITMIPVGDPVKAAGSEIIDKNTLKLGGAATGLYVYIGGGYNVPIAVQGTDYPVDFPTADSIIAQAPSPCEQIWNTTIPADGELVYNLTTQHIVLFSFNCNMTTANPSGDVVKITLYKNGIPDNGGFFSSSQLIRSTESISLCIPLSGDAVVFGDVFKIYVANMTSTNTLTFGTGSGFGGFSYCIFN